MAKWLVGQCMDKLIFGPIFDKLINAGFEYLKYQPKMKDMLQRLRDNYPKIQAIVSVALRAHRAQMLDQDPALNKWIWQIRDAIDEADDFFDELEYLNHKEQLDRNKEENKVRSISNILSNPAKRLRAGNEDHLDLNKLEELVQKLDNIFAGAGPFLHLLEIIKHEQQEQQVELHKTRETGSLPKDDLIGRGEDKEFVIQWLRQQPSDVTTTALYRNISLLSIVGHGGMGKTTLLQHVYQDEIKKEFDVNMWVCVSDNFDVKKVITDMLECLQKGRSSLESLHALQESLQSEVMSKKFLLVLDDLWDKEEEDVLCCKWGGVLAPLAYGGLGSKILITTRMGSVASMIAKVIKKKNEMLAIKGLEDDECLQLLNNHAFVDVENPDDYKQLRSIVGEFVKKLYGSPLAAKVMGGVLNSSLDERHWKNVLNRSLDLNAIFPILELSYIFLPKHLQSCFSFCSIFEQDHIFYKDDLVRMWIVVGFIQPSHIQDRSLTLEDIGERYFDLLIKKSFFEKPFEEYAYARRYKMHDLLHELAQYVSTQECFRFVGDEKSLFLEIPETIRHLSVKTSNLKMLKKMGRFKNLRTLHIKSNNQSFVDALDKMLKVTRSIRLLCINDIKLKLIPESIGYLHHLRYLSFCFEDVNLLPRSISSLYHLQFIINERNGWKTECPDDFFPRDMNNLSNLRYFNHPWLIFPGFGKLKFLQQVNRFQIKNEKGHRIAEVEHMNELVILGILNLENLRDAQEACNAKLCDKRRLTDLSLDWGVEERDIIDHDLDERVLDNLQPHNYLKELSIKKYRGLRSAIWMNEAHLIKNLVRINLSGCSEWEILPPFGQLPFLDTLSLDNMAKAKRLENKFHGNDRCCFFPSLQRLYLRNMEALVDWFDASVVDGLFPCLYSLYLLNCPNLQELPYLPPKLKSLVINNIGWKTLNCCSISKSIPLEILEVRGCENITSISLAGEIGKLKSLTILDCPNLISLGEEHQEVEAIENRLLILDYLNINDPSVLQMEPLRSSNSIRRLILKNPQSSTQRITSSSFIFLPP